MREAHDTENNRVYSYIALQNKRMKIFPHITIVDLFEFTFELSKKKRQSTTKVHHTFTDLMKTLRTYIHIHFFPI